MRAFTRPEIRRGMYVGRSVLFPLASSRIARSGGADAPLPVGRSTCALYGALYNRGGEGRPRPQRPHTEAHCTGRRPLPPLFRPDTGSAHDVAASNSGGARFAHRLPLSRLVERCRAARGALEGMFVEGLFAARRPDERRPNGTRQMVWRRKGRRPEGRRAKKHGRISGGCRVGRCRYGG